MIKNKNEIAIILNLLCVICGIIIFTFSYYHEYMYIFWVWMVTAVLAFTALSDLNRIIRPVSFFILSFIVFVWMRLILNIMFGTVVISIGEKITSNNVFKTSLFLGIIMCTMIVIAIFTETILNKSQIDIFCTPKKIFVEYRISIPLLLLASICFLLFLLDSVNKIKIIKSYDYLLISESLLTTGYIFFRFGKYFILLWVLFGKNENRMYYASTILLLASIGYLMLGSRGYAICYFFLWLIFFQRKYKIKFVWLSIIGVGLIILANKILEYRLGYHVSYGFLNTVINTLHSQGASIEPVFGSVNFRSELLEMFPKQELLSRGDFGNYIDMARGVNFAQGGFSTSFFAEVYFLGIPGLAFAVLMGICVGILEHGYKIITNRPDISNYYNILLFMTCPNLIYFARSNIKDYIFKSFSTYMILLGLIFIVQNKCMGHFVHKVRSNVCH